MKNRTYLITNIILFVVVINTVFTIGLNFKDSETIPSCDTIPGYFWDPVSIADRLYYMDLCENTESIMGINQ
jgi:hypothetical protein